MRIFYSNQIPRDLNKITWTEAFLSLFTADYRKHRLEYVAMAGKKDGKLVLVPYHQQWHPWKREWVNLYCVQMSSLTARQHLELARENVKKMEDKVKAADKFCKGLIASFGDNIANSVVGVRGDGNELRFLSASTLSDVKDVPEKAGRTLKSKPVTEPRRSNNNGKGNNNQNK